MTELQSIIVFHGSHFVRHLGICNPICVKLLQIMSGVILRNIKKRRLYLKTFPEVHKRGTHTHRQIDTHDDGIRRKKMQCIEFRLIRCPVVTTIFDLRFYEQTSSKLRQSS